MRDPGDGCLKRELGFDIGRVENNS